MKKELGLNLKVVPLGGCNEIGKNCTLFEYNNEIVIIDCGIGFPNSILKAYGVDLIIPDFTYILKNKKKIKAILLTHGHEDHIGAVSYLLQHISIPVYGSTFTLKLLENRVKEVKIFSETIFHHVEYDQEIVLSENFQFELIRTTHSIIDSAAILLKTPLGSILHTGDFKVDYTPIDKKRFDFFRFSEIGKKGLLLLLSDSTNALYSGYSESESSIIDSLKKIFSDSPQAIFVATFASHIHRIQTLFNLSKGSDRYVVLAGKSIETNVEMAIQLGYLDKSNVKILSVKKIKDIPRNKLLIITTGTQGEPMSVLSLLSQKTHKILKIRKNDTIIISARVIPGNEKEVNRIINQFFQFGARMIYEPFYDIHVSGHAYKEELKMMLSLTKPMFFLPLHGEYKNLLAHVEIAHELDIPYENSKVMRNGDVIEITEQAMRKIGTVENQEIYINNGPVKNEIEDQMVKDRKKLSSLGVFILVIYWENVVEKKVFNLEKVKYHIISRGGFSDKIMKILTKRIKKVILESFNQEKLVDLKNNMNDELYVYMKKNLTIKLKKLFRKLKQNQPMIVVHII